MSNYRLEKTAPWKLKFSERIKSIRKNTKQTQESFAAWLGVNPQVISNWECCKAAPVLEDMINLAETFNCDLDYLIGRIDEPTHEIKAIHELTGLSVEAITKLIKNKDKVSDSPLSDIISHKDSSRLLRTLALSADEDEIAWLNLDELPNGLSSSYADKPIDFTVGVGADVADFLSSQELISIVRKIRERREKERRTQNRKNLEAQYTIYTAKRERDDIVERLEQECVDLGSMILNFEQTEEIPPEEISAYKRDLEKTETLLQKARNASFAEWKRGTIVKEFNDLCGKE